ncbi:MAG TPA: hypothetical protein V6D20_15870, partial [Candidatus Obscuribacterales bacterium]
QLSQKISKFTTSLRSSTLSRNEAWLAMTTRINKSLEYVMPASTLTEKDWDKLMKRLMPTALQKSGFASNFPRSIIFGPLEHMGTGLIHPYYRQELIHLQLCMDEINHDTFLGNLLRISFEQLHLDLGHLGQITDAPPSMHAAVTQTWTSKTWLFGLQHNITITDRTPILQRARSHDTLLMQAFTMAKYKGASLRRLNDCRKYLQIVSLADITSKKTTYNRNASGESTGTTHGTSMGGQGNNLLFLRNIGHYGRKR